MRDTYIQEKLPAKKKFMPGFKDFEYILSLGENGRKIFCEQAITITMSLLVLAIMASN